MAETGFDRILVCKHHGVMYKMRPYDGPPEYDQELIELCNRHNAQPRIRLATYPRQCSVS